MFPDISQRVLFASFHQKPNAKGHRSVVPSRSPARHLVPAIRISWKFQRAQRCWGWCPGPLCVRNAQAQVAHLPMKLYEIIPILFPMILRLKPKKLMNNQSPITNPVHPSTIHILLPYHLSAPQKISKKTSCAFNFLWTSRPLACA